MLWAITRERVVCMGCIYTPSSSQQLPAAASSHLLGATDAMLWAMAHHRKYKLLVHEAFL